MPGAMPCEKRHVLAAQPAEHVGPRRIAEWRGDDLFTAVGQLRHVVQTAATNDADAYCWMCHLPFCSRILAMGTAGS